MTPQEKAINLVCRKCATKGQCKRELCYVFKQMIQMHEWTINKVCEWIQNKAPLYYQFGANEQLFFNHNDMIEDLKKEMEEL